VQESICAFAYKDVERALLPVGCGSIRIGRSEVPVLRLWLAQKVWRCLKRSPSNDNRKKSISYFKLFAAVKALFIWQRNDGPGGRKKADDIFGAEAFEEDAALHLNLNSAASGLHRNFADIENVAAFAVIHLIVGHEAIAGDDDVSFW
jgi:hypothetical protein